MLARSGCPGGWPALVLLAGMALPGGALAESPSVEEFHTLRVGDLLPEVDFALADGSRVGREQLLGRVAVIDFWATWCAPCLGAFPKFNALEEQFGDRPIAFFSVTYESAEKIEPVLAEHPLKTAIGFDNDFATFRAFRAWGIPVTYVFDGDGVLLAALHPEHLTAEVLESALAGEIPDVEQTRGWPDPVGAEEHFRSLPD